MSGAGSSLFIDIVGVITVIGLAAGWQLFDALAMTLSEVLRAAGDTSWTLYARIILAWGLFLPVSLANTYLFGLGHVAAMLTVAGYIAVIAALFYWRFRSGRWREIDLTGSEPPVD